MKVMLFAAGLGTRLKPYTDHHPKALVEVAGKPLIEHVLTKLIQHGATEVVVNAHHFANQIHEYFQKHDFGISIQISDESDQLLDTGGGLRKAAQLFSNDERPILIHNVDIFSNANLTQFYAAHQNSDAALIVSERDTSRYLLFNEQQLLVGWTNLKTGEIRLPVKGEKGKTAKRLAFSGIHLISPRLIKEMKNFPDKFSIIEFYLQQCNNYNILAHIPPSLKLLDVGKVDSLRSAEEFIQPPISTENEHSH